MLTEKDKGQVLCFKLVTGEEILAEVVDITATTVHVKTPAAVGLAEQGLALRPWLLFADRSQQECVIAFQSILTAYSPHQEILNGYQAQFGKIVTPQPGIILGQANG